MLLKALPSFFLALAIATVPASAQTLPDGLDGQWQSDLKNCALPENQRVKGEYLTIF